MIETQNIEWKESWRDEYLQWISGFANAQGGVLIIGKNDDGEIIGLKDPKKLMEDLPNKIRDTLGIIVEINLLKKNNVEYIEVVVPTYPQGISYKGKFYYRTGSTNQLLNGIALQKFFNKKRGKTWDEASVPCVTVDDLSGKALKIFRETAAKKERISKEVLDDENIVVLENLRLIENGYLNHAAILLFHDNPERYIGGAYIKVGFFETDSDLRFQDEIYGSLMEQVSKALELLYSKYMKAWISYDGIQRIEKYPYPDAALREAIFNAVAHKDYSSGVPIQISVYSDKLYIYNDGKLPEEWTIEKLFAKHPSKPFNPLIAQTFFIAGYIESWGRGVSKICEACENAKLPKPEYEIDKTGIMLLLKAVIDWNGNKISYDENGNITQHLKRAMYDSDKKLNDLEKQVLKLFKENSNYTTKVIAKKTGKETRQIQRVISELKNKGLVFREGSNKAGRWITNDLD